MTGARELKRDILEHEFIYDRAQVLDLLGETFRDFRPSELAGLCERTAVGCREVGGVRRYHRRFLANILHTRPDWVARLPVPDPGQAAEEARQRALMENRALLRERGSCAARLTVRHTLRLKPEAVRPEGRLTVHLPVPRACALQGDIELVELSHRDRAVVAPPHALQRTVAFVDVPAEDTFSVTYRWTNRLNYVNLKDGRGRPGYPEEAAAFLGQRLPHIRFSPAMEARAAQLRGDGTDPLETARRIYDFVTREVAYSYMPEYAVLPALCDFTDRRRCGDCGAQAILFITLCRLSGIPARWQSGLAAGPDRVGCHDWAEFYVAPYGWLYADCSYGGGAWRRGDRAGWDHYFGNLDLYRMAANGDLLRGFTPRKRQARIDPVDNQRGEAEYRDAGLRYYQVEHSEELLELEML